MTAPVSRTGLGFDVHPFDEDRSRPLVLGGVQIPGGRALSGHSDADVVAHAVADACLGGACLGDLGGRFPDTDRRWEGADSLILLRRVVELVAGEGWRPVHGDCTVVADAPALAGHLGSMSVRLGEVLGAPVNVKAKRAEGLGALGRAEGVACLAVVTLEPA